MKNLLYITSEYPNVRGDTAFIETEIKYVAKKFDNIIVCSHGSPETDCVATPPNVQVFYFDKRMKYFRRFCLCLFSLFDIAFYKEIKSIFQNKKHIFCVITALKFISAAKLEIQQIKRLILKFKINSLYTFWFWSSTLACVLIKRQFFKEISIFTRTHGFDLYEFRDKKKYQPYKIQMDRLINKVFFISKDGLNYYKQNFHPIDENTYELSYLGTENNSLVRPHNYSDVIQLLSVSNVVPVKRVHLIIDALVRCSEEKIKLHWTHIGNGSCFLTCKKLANVKLNNTSVVFNFLGELPNKEVHNYYKTNSVDLFVNTSESEGLPVSMMEAMSFGIPVIAPDVGGIREIVDEKSGWLLSKYSCNEEFVDVIKLWNNFTLEQKRNKSKAAYDKWNCCFNAEKNYGKFSEELLMLDTKITDIR